MPSLDERSKQNTAELPQIMTFHFQAIFAIHRPKKADFQANSRKVLRVQQQKAK